jgi:adenosylhomocysteine nucleosidase
MRRAKIGFVVGLRAEARLLRGLGFQVAIGGGMPEGAARAAEALIAADAEALISFGLAGGLVFGIAAGALVIPSRVRACDQVFVCDTDLVGWLGGATATTMLAGQEIAVTAMRKADLFARSGASAIDLESGAVARVATAATVPFAVLRAVADPADRDLPPAAVTALSEAGKIKGGKVLGSVLRQPGQIGELVLLARNAAAARSALVRRLRRLS